VATADTDDYINLIFGVGQVPFGYYNNTEGLTGDDLKKQLHVIIRDHKRFTYDQVWDALQRIDENPYNTNEVILFYTMRSQPKAERDRGPQYDYAANGYSLSNAWNREHVWAKSRGFPDDDDTAYTDLHHLRPADRSVNSSRNNRSFNLCDEPYFDTGNVPTSCFQCSDEWAWEPPDQVKGDVARMIFYMAVRYEGYTFYGETKRDLEVVDSILHKDIKEPLQGKLSTLLAWHQQDPVDNWERRRNHIIYYGYQGNRNPFIDHPEFVEKIWQNIDQ
jgi:endonuclease I